MASQAILSRLQAEFDSPPDAIAAAVALLEQNAPPAFIARYRRAQGGDMGEERLHSLADRLHFLAELEVRKQAIAQQAQERGKLTPELQAVLDESVDQDLIDDLYQSMRPRRRTPAMQMEEKGLQPLALAIEHRQLGELTLQAAAQEYVSEANGLPAPESVLEGVLLILSERIAADPKTRTRMRRELQNGLLRARPVNPGQGSAQRYQEFFDFQETITRIPAQRMLALRRAEREGILQLELTLPEGRAREVLRELHAADLAEGAPLREFMDLVFDHTFEHHLKESCGRDVRRRLKEKADREAVRTFARNLRSQLLSPALGGKKVLTLRASTKSAWAALLGEDGSVLQHRSMQVGNDEERKAALDWMVATIGGEQPAAIAIPHGRRQTGTEGLVTALREAASGQLPPVIPVDEAASAIFATSAQGRRALPGVEVGIRTAISLGRRLQDPMRELIRMDFRTLGLGQTLDDVHQGILRRELDWVVTSCVASVGTDLNTADQATLAHVPGITGELAAAIVEHRRKHGGFRNRAALLAVPGIDADRLRYIGGFLLIHGGDEPLDATTVHPDDYGIARSIAERKGVPIEQLFGADLRDVDLDAHTGDGVDRNRVLGVLQALRSAGSDPRGEVGALRNDGIQSMTDLRIDLELTGRVTNLTEFGAFVDLGIGQDGLVHISQIPQQRLRNPDQMLRVGEVVKVWVVNVDQAARKIGLSMHRPRHMQEGRQPTLGERMQGGRRGRRPREAQPVLTRAARTPEGRRGGRRGPDRREGPSGPREGRGERRHEGRYDRGPRERRGDGEPRVFTIESGSAHVEQKGHKGEFTSLASLRSLLQRKGEEPAGDVPAAKPDPAAPPTDPAS